MAGPASLAPKLPSGYRLLRMETVDSTNAEAKRRAAAGEPGPLWIWSARQSHGRGRQGRDWQSLHGNLFASLLIVVDCPLQTASQLALLAGVVAFDTVAALAPATKSELLLKWPNDILLGEAKLAGMLLETVGTASGDRSTVVIGTGINLASHPRDLPHPATSLAAHGVEATPGEALQLLADTTTAWLARWGAGAGFPTVRRAWLERAGALGRPLRVQLNGRDVDGEYAGLDANGALRLRTPDGAEHRVTAGDVFLLSA